MHVIMIRWHAMHFIHSSLVEVQMNVTLLRDGQMATWAQLFEGRLAPTRG